MDFTQFQSDQFSRKDFEFLKPLNHSKSYSVNKVTHIKTNTIYALKSLEKSQIDSPTKLSNLINEKKTLQSLSHPGIIRLISTFTDAEYIYFLLEYCENNDLNSFIRRFPAFPHELVRFYSGQIASVLHYLSKQNTVHGSLKPDNILLDHKFHIKLTDFSNTLQLRPKSWYQESPDYIAPELLNGETSGKAADLWAFGCIIYQMLVGTSPFVSSNTQITCERIRDCTVDFPLSLTPLAIDFIQSLILPDARLRMGVEDIDDLTTHIFLQGINFVKIFEKPVPDYLDEMIPVATDEKIIKKEIVKKKCGWIYKKRILELNERPELKYYDPGKGEVRGSIEISPQLKVEIKGKNEFHVVVPKRTYFFKVDKGAEEWKTAIYELIRKFYG